MRWNPSVGCNFNCTYCKPSFQALVRRTGSKINCQDCIDFTPHNHPERLSRIPSSEIVWPFACGDISFYDKHFVKKAIEELIYKVRRSKTIKTVYFQSKNPAVFNIYLADFEKLLKYCNVYLLTTLETNRSIFIDGTAYADISKAPEPVHRYKDFKIIDWHKKIVTIEPIMQFDLDVMTRWIQEIQPRKVYIGYNSKPKQVKLPEPSFNKFKELCENIAGDRDVYVKNVDRLPAGIKQQLSQYKQ